MALKTVIVVGGSYVGSNVAQQLAIISKGRFRILLIEKNSHFQHLFSFPRFAATRKVNTHKAFIPFGPATFGTAPNGIGRVIQAAVTSLTESNVQLDREIILDGQHTDNIAYSFLVLATGTKLTPPSNMPGSEKHDGVAYLQNHASQVAERSRIVVIGAGAVGVQLAFDIKELYPEKSVTLVHSRNTLMNRFHVGLSNLVIERCKELGVDLELGSRVKLPTNGYPTDGSSFQVELLNGKKIPSDFAIICTGMTPQSAILQSLSSGVINSDGFVRVRNTLQIDDPAYPNVFALGDIANTDAPKAARPALKQAEIVAKNVSHLIEGEDLEAYECIDPPAIHLTLGIKKNAVFRNPVPGSNEPVIMLRDDGTLDMNIDDVWTRRGGGPDAML
ncbi:hypothetical protein M433DRAFT_74468 [Acidomyces richmondensis BFW]|nr:hypothetical protein M433DRAFT_74468 [Acidomyces richmondensis BFW]